MSNDISALLRLQPQPLREPRFVADAHLGRLVRDLRMLGFHTIYHDHAQDEELAAISSNERRILLTRDRGLLKRNVVTRGYCVRATDSREQLVEVLRRFDLLGVIAPFSRCVQCNSLLRPTLKDLISARLPPKTEQYCDEFHVCRAVNESTGKVHTTGACSDWSRSFSSGKEVLIRRGLNVGKGNNLFSVPAEVRRPARGGMD